MPRRFLKNDDRESLNNFPSLIDEEDAIKHFLLTPDDLAQVSLNRSNTQRLGYAVLLCGLRYLGFFPEKVDSIPENAADYLAKQLNCHVDDLLDYGYRYKTRKDHQRFIRQYLGFHLFKQEEERRLFEWLSQRALENDRPATLLQQASEWLYKQKIVRPGITSLEEIVLASRDKAHQLTYEQVLQVLNPDLAKQLDGLLDPNLELGATALAWLRTPASGYGAADINKVLEKLDFVYAWSIEDWEDLHLPPARIHHLVQIARRSSNQALQRKVAQERYPLLLAFVADSRERLTDEVIDLYEQRIVQTERDARQDLQAHRLKISEALQQVAWYFGKTTPILLNEEEIPDIEVRPQIFKLVSRAELEESLRILSEQEQDLDEIDFIAKRYSYLRQFFPRFIASLKFHAYQEQDSLLDAIGILQAMNIASERLPKFLSNVPTDFIPKDWRRRVLNPDGTVNRLWYDLCVMWELRNALRSGRIWLEHSRRYTHLDTYLMPKDIWNTKQDVFFDLVPIERSWAERRKTLQWQLESAFQALNDQLPHDDFLRIEDGRLILSPYEGDENQHPLAQQIQDLLPHLQLPELLHEVDSWTNFSRHLEHAAHASSRINDLPRHLYAVILAQARNIDFKQMVDVVDLSYSQLLWCNNWYIREETLQKVIEELVNYQYRQALSHYWGDGRFSSSDGQRFPVSVRTQNASPLPRYFAYGRGLTFLTWTSNQYSQYGTLVTPPTHREAAYTLDKILDHDSELDIQEHTTDTDGYTDIIFALFDLLGMQFAPRIKDISTTRLFRMDTKTIYENLKALNFYKLHLEQLVGQNWDEMLRLVASLKFRWTTPSLIIRKLQAFPRQHILTQALQEYGRLVKTIFILRYYLSEAYRRRIDTQLNKGEKFHALRAYIHSANRGSIRKKYPEQHLNQANCLNLIVNAIAVWNTVYMQAAVQHLRQNGQIISEEDLEHLSPVRYEHINIFGKYSFDRPSQLTDEGLRPLLIKH